MKLILHLVDFRHGLLKNDRELQEWLRAYEKNIFVVFTKADKIPKSKWLATKQSYIKDGLFSCDIPIITSSEKNEKKEGIESLCEFIANFLAF